MPSVDTTEFGASTDRLHRRVRRRVKHHYFQVMPDNPRHRSFIWAVFWIISGIILVQLMYPLERALPFARINNQPVGWQQETELAARIVTLFDATNVQLRLDEHTANVPLKEFGAEPETAAMVRQLTRYPFWQRYIPLSIFFQPATLTTGQVTYTHAVARERCAALAKEFSYAPTNASLELLGDKLVATNEKSGRTVDARKICQRIQQQTVKLAKTNNLSVPVTIVPPERTREDFSAVRAQAERALTHEIVFTYDERQFKPTHAQVASWLQLKEANGGETVLALNEADFRKYLQSIDKTIGRPAGTTHVRVVNGLEVGRTPGQPGKRVDVRVALQPLRAQLLEQQIAQPIELALVDIEPTITFNNRYTATEAGLQAYINDAGKDYNAHIMVRQLGGEGWEAGARQYESIPSASTYKLYVAMWLFDQMEQSKTSWDTPILDTTVTTCFDRMTIASTNACAQEWLAQMGRENMNQYLYAHGFSRGTTFTSPIAVHTTAADLTNYMTRLDRGELYADIYKNRLLQSLGSHPYPFGIPAGSVGRVHDKVGFLWDYVHDTAIVEHPRGRYVLTVMTKGQSYARIASITREIERIMYP